MMGRKGSLFVISAPSGAGKSTLIGALMERVGQIGFSVSHTTRPPREGEKNGVHYHFVSREEFQRLADGGEFAEWATVHGNLYGTGKTALKETLEAGKDVILDIDVQGAESVAKSMPEAVLVFILPPSLAELEKRLKGRGKDAEEVIRTRLANAAHEISRAGAYDYLIVNDDLLRAGSELEAVVLASRLRVSVQPGLLAAFGS